MMTDDVFKSGVVGPVAAGLSVLDMAHWDFKAKANDYRLWKTLGAAKPRVRAYYERMATHGVPASKLKGGLTSKRI